MSCLKNVKFCLRNFYNIFNLTVKINLKFWSMHMIDTKVEIKNYDSIFEGQLFEEIF